MTKEQIPKFFIALNQSIEELRISIWKNRDNGKEGFAEIVELPDIYSKHTHTEIGTFESYLLEVPFSCKFLERIGVLFYLPSYG